MTDLSSPKTQRILLFTTAYEPLIGGSEIAIAEVTKRLPDAFFDIVTPRYSRKDLPREDKGNITIHRIGPGGSMSKWLFPVLGYFKGRSLLKKSSYDAIHAWQASFASGAAWNIKKFTAQSPPLIVTLQEGKDLDRQSLFVRYFRKTILRGADHITAISKYLAEFGSSLETNATISIIPNGVDTEKFSIDFGLGEILELKKTLDIPNDAKILFTSSRLVQKNAVDDVIRSLVLDGMENTYFVIAGSGEQKNMLTRIASTLGVESRVKYLGDVNHENLYRYIKMADIFVRPSRSEGLGISFLEAMAAGTPIVGTNVGGIPDFLQEEVTGVFCEPNNPGSIAKAVIRLIRDPELASTIKANGIELVTQRYSWETIAQMYSRLYDIVNQS